MFFTKQETNETPKKTIYDYVPPVPQEGRNTSFCYRNDAFIPVDRMKDERYMNEPEKVLLDFEKCKKTETFGGAIVYQATPQTSASDFQFAVFIPLENKSFVFFCEDAIFFGQFMRKFWPIMPWIELYLPKDVTQFVPSYRPINKNSSF